MKRGKFLLQCLTALTAFAMSFDPTLAQNRRPVEARLRVTVVDQTGAAITNARVANNIEVKLEVANVQEEVTVGRDKREAGTDPRNAISSVLTEEQIAQLPDDPEEFEQALRNLAGPGATFRVNGFRGGKLPPKSQIREIRFRTNAYAAESHESSC